MGNPYHRAPRFGERFEPGIVPGLVAAWLPDRGFAEFGSVDVWPDVSGNGRDATQFSAPAQPVVDKDGYLPAHPMVVWDGTSDFLDVTWVEPSLDESAFTFYTVLNQVDDGTEQIIFSGWDSTSGTGEGTQLILYARTAGGQISVFDGDLEFKDVGPTQAGRQVLTWCLDMFNATFSVYRNNTLIGTDTFNRPDKWDTVRLGADATDSGTKNYNGGMYMFAYEGVHDADTRARVIAALQRLSPITELLYTAVAIGGTQIAVEPYPGESAPSYYDSNVLTHDGVDFLLATTDRGDTPPGIGLVPMGVAVNVQARKGTVLVIGPTNANTLIAADAVGGANHTAMVARVTAAGVTPSICIFSQGDTDVLSATPKASFKADMEGICADIETRWPGITIIILQTQKVAGVFFDEADSLPIREAQQEVADAGADRLIITDVDHLNNLRLDSFIPNTIGRDIIAGYFAALAP